MYFFTLELGDLYHYFRKYFMFIHFPKIIYFWVSNDDIYLSAVNMNFPHGVICTPRSIDRCPNIISPSPPFSSVCGVSESSLGIVKGNLLTSPDLSATIIAGLGF